jgi:1,4-dihydroxy-2-naphthoate octaprenyltransferase
LKVADALELGRGKAGVQHTPADPPDPGRDLNEDRLRRAHRTGHTSRGFASMRAVPGSGRLDGPHPPNAVPHMNDSVSSSATIAPGSWAAWKVALRPQTFPIAVVPVVAGTAIAWSQFGAFTGWIMALALAGALLVQAITNLQNDVGYTVRRGETGTRTGMPRATANGWLAVPRVRAAIVLLVVMALLVGAPLVAHRGALVLAMVVSSIVAAWAYMGGPRPIAYTPLGECTVFAFFGVMAVCGTVYVQAGQVGAPGWIAGIAVGLLAASVLTVNNHRDIAHDRSTGRRTLAVVVGPAASRAVYRLSVFVAFALVPVLAWVAGSVWYLLPLVALPVASATLRAFDASPGGHGLTPVLLRTVLLEAAFGLLLAAAAVLARVAG